MANNLLKQEWGALDSHELRLLLDEYMRSHGQFDGDNDILHLPMARESCRLKLIYDGAKIVSVEAGPAFVESEWALICRDIETAVLAGPTRVGREFSFCSFEVQGSWLGKQSGVQILPPPKEVPRATSHAGENPFILEFPFASSRIMSITLHRRRIEHRNVTLLLGVLFAGRVNVQPQRTDYFWARVPVEDGCIEKLRKKVRLACPWLFRRSTNPPATAYASQWVQEGFYANVGEGVRDEVSAPAESVLEEVESEDYYVAVGHDGRGLRVPSDLDQSIFLYQQLAPRNREKFNRAAFWLDMARRQWTISVSASFSSLISALEAFIDRGSQHSLHCDRCDKAYSHDAPGSTQNFHSFIETYAPGATLKESRTAMYALRSGILHGSKLMYLDQDLAFGWDPPWWNQYQLNNELWRLTKIAMRNWLKNPPKSL